MALEKTKFSSPWWLSAVLFLGLVFIFMGERAFAHTGAASKLSWLGTILVAGSVGLRGWVIIKTTGSQRKIEMVSILSNVGTLLALIGYYLTTKSGMSIFGVEGETAVERWTMSMNVLWMILLIVSLVPLLLIEISLGTERRNNFVHIGNEEGAAVDVYRVREMANSGLSIALAAAFLMVTCNIADERNVRRDVSYFKTSSPGSATINIAKTLNEPLRVLTFFPEDSDVGLEVEAYIKALSSEVSSVQHEALDRLLDSALAKEHQIGKEGTILLIRGEKAEKFTISTDMKIARKTALREFDASFQESLMAVIRDAKVAYLMVGHGELNDPDSGGSFTAKSLLNKTTVFRKKLKGLNYKIETYGGFGKPIPDDCSVLFVLAPRVALLDSELLAIDDYLAKGGSAIIAFDPDANMELGLLQKRLGVAFNPTPLSDDKDFMPRTRTASDHSLILTNQFLSHASIPTLSSGSEQAAMLFVKSGSFDELPAENKDSPLKKSQIIRSMPTTWRDSVGIDGNNNFVLDSGTEKRDRYTIAMAIEDKTAVPDKLPEDAKHKGMRVVLLADSEVLSDGIMGRLAVAQNMLKDIVNWTGGEEAYAGETTDEKDKRIEHTKSQDAVWFYGTMAGAPLLVLAFGLLFIGRRKKRTQKTPKKSTTGGKSS